MANVILYKEIITRSGRNVGGLRHPFRSMRASRAGVKVTVDGQQHHLRSTVPHSIGLAPGRHEFIAAGRGFARAVERVDVAHDDLIVAISPDYTVSVSPDTPLGSLRIRPVEGRRSFSRTASTRDSPLHISGNRSFLRWGCQWFYPWLAFWPVSPV